VILVATQSVDALVDGGKASAAPPLGPALGPLGVNIGKVVAEINKQTDAFKGMKVPVKVVVDTGTKEFTISVGTPPAAQLIKTEARLEKASGRPNTEHVADLRIEQIIKIAKMKQSSLLGKDLKARVKEIIGTCNAMGIMVEGKHAAETIKRVDANEFDEQIRTEKTELTADELAKLEEEKVALQAELEKRHAAMEKLAREILESLVGDTVKARKKMEEAGIVESVIDKVAPKPAAAAPPEKK
jgi:large subunit ribosomal protein L11